MKYRVKFISMNAFPDENVDVIYALDDHGYIWRSVSNDTGKLEWERLQSPDVDVERSTGSYGTVKVRSNA